MPSKYFALVDCNNFFVSCERLFRPDLKHKPVLVLSNNDGCVISRSNEVKALGIKMGTPFYQIKDLVKHYKIATFSTNFPLYLDISNRVTSTLEDFCPSLENYSIDESFLDLTGFSKKYNIFDYCGKIHFQTIRDTGIPVCVGAGPTKTLAKIANYGAKKNFNIGGVLTIDTEAERIDLLKRTPLEEVWGIGKALSTKLKDDLGLNTALDLSRCNLDLIRFNYNVTVAKTVMELQGIPCLELEDIPKAKKQMMWSRTFGQKLTSFDQLREAIAGFTVAVAQKLREEKQYTRNIGIFIRTNFHNMYEKQYSNSISFTFDKPINDTEILLKATQYLLTKIYRPNFYYNKAGVILQDLTTDGTYQSDLFTTDNPITDAKRQKLMQVLDTINAKKHNTVYFAAQGIDVQKGVSHQGMLSPAYTTNWKDIPKVK